MPRLRALDAAAYAFQQAIGAEAIIRWHQREIARLEACLPTVNRGEPALTAEVPPSGDAEWTDATVARLTDAVNFYARPDIYKARKGRTPAVIADGGATAREAMHAVYGDDASGGGE